MKQLIIAFAILLTFVYAQTAFAQQPSLVVSMPPVSATPVPTIDYALPYPGLLADNPLYPLKTLRDNIVGWMIRDPLKKSAFDLLQADKRLEGGAFLIQQNPSKFSLALSTISKGDNYFSQAVDKVIEAKKEGMVIADLMRKLNTASLKHEEVLKTLESQVSGNNKAGIKFEEKRVADIHQQLMLLLPK
ncbi:MAG TPA: hypothetical protein VMR41_02750 [Patescibacteria group bacterium]|nr:hypothetical protein [Patescibacteria group bacterium]